MSIKQKLRRIRLSIGKYFLDRGTPPLEITTPPGKILFLRHDGKIGDYIVSSFVFREIKKQYPDSHIGVVCTEKNAYLFEANPYIDQLHLLKKRSIISMVKCGLNLGRFFHYDAVIDPTVLLRNRDLLLLRLIKAPLNIGYLKKDYKIFNKNITDADLHFSEVYTRALQLSGFNKIDNTYDIPYRQDSAQRVKEFLAKNQLSEFIALNCYGQGSARRFNPEKITALLHYLNAHTQKPVLLLSYPEVSKNLSALAAPFKGVIIDTEMTTIFDCIEYIRECDLLISPDTATIHIAVGLNKPLIGFYSEDQENFKHWHPNSKNTTHILRYRQTINEIKPEQIKPEWLEN
ncbi:ADP-heptose:LPS heptosyltransferase [Mesocricetibacter intestinalis]|uniref:ADP-heptose:LPS heptosyltransferase n=1 Tax=Mesocricetibacter intestinalis TaxID=1521930 RepID=A0A4R6V8V1_9PAST|nr:glycosyltransferase family 9 protein [Mesocricetibacter intestinalis]TDQ58071.1 ADP-heptose:LPS heptosyltransferase [Mesocricetibacter intestinalis]